MNLRKKPHQVETSNTTAVFYSNAEEFKADLDAILVKVGALQRSLQDLSETVEGIGPLELIFGIKVKEVNG